MCASDPHPLIMQELRRQWKGLATFVVSFIKEIVGIRQIEGIYVNEYLSADFERAICTGPIARTWFFDGKTFNESTLPERIEQPTAIWTPTPVLSYFFRESDNQFVITWWSGVRAAHGATYTISEKQGHSFLEPLRPCWRA